MFTDGPAKSVTDVAGQRVFVLWRSYGNGLAQRPPADDRPRARPRRRSPRRTGGRVPAWLSEGTAMYVSSDKRAGDAGALLSGAQLKDSSKQKSAENVLSLARLSKRDSLPQHVRDPAVVRVLLLLRGGVRRSRPSTAAPRRCCGSIRAYNSEKIKGKPGRELTNRVFKKVLKKSLKQVECRRSRRTPRTQSPVLASLLGRYARAARSRDDPRPSGAPRRRAGAGDRGDPRRALVPAAGARGAAGRAARAGGSRSSAAAASTSSGSSKTTSSCSCTCA